MYSDDALLVSSDRHCSLKSSVSLGFLSLFLVLISYLKAFIYDGCEETLMLRQLPELAKNLGKEQKAQRGLNSPIHLSDRLIPGHDDQGINADCKSSP